MSKTHAKCKMSNVTFTLTLYYSSSYIQPSAWNSSCDVWLLYFCSVKGEEEGRRNSNSELLWSKSLPPNYTVHLQDNLSSGCFESSCFNGTTVLQMSGQVKVVNHQHARLLRQHLNTGSLSLEADALNFKINCAPLDCFRGYIKTYQIWHFRLKPPPDALDYIQRHACWIQFVLKSES